MTAHVVENRELSIRRADEISSLMADVLIKECQKEENNRDPAEQIYLTAHTIGCLVAKISLSMGGYGKTNGIEKLTPEKFREWVIAVSKDYEAFGGYKCDL